jgi:pimeloyl-ACP methyl ester carboxylesterase
MSPRPRVRFNGNIHDLLVLDPVWDAAAATPAVELAIHVVGRAIVIQRGARPVPGELLTAHLGVGSRPASRGRVGRALGSGLVIYPDARAGCDVHARRYRRVGSSCGLEIIDTLDEKPAVIGHSTGGLLAQMLAGRGLSAATVAIDPGVFRGVLPLPASVLKGWARCWSTRSRAVAPSRSRSTSSPTAGRTRWTTRRRKSSTTRSTSPAPGSLSCRWATRTSTRGPRRRWTIATHRDRHHPLMGNDLGGAYDRFRAVHDVLGHARLRLRFDRDGEFVVWRSQERSTARSPAGRSPPSCTASTASCGRPASWPSPRRSSSPPGSCAARSPQPSVQFPVQQHQRNARHETRRDRRQRAHRLEARDLVPCQATFAPLGPGTDRRRSGARWAGDHVQPRTLGSCHPMLGALPETASNHCPFRLTQ